MIEFRHVLCPVDLSELSPATFRVAAMVAQRYGASLTVLEMIWVGVSVDTDSTPLEMAPAHRKRFTGELQAFVDAHAPAGLAVNVAVREGPVVQGILDEQRARGCDLIVMGTHGRGGFDRLVLGSVAEKVLRKAPCPVLTVPPGARKADGAVAPLRTILCAVDFSPASLVALTYALSLTEERDRHLILLHVFDGPIDRSSPTDVAPEQAEPGPSREALARQGLHDAVPESARTSGEVIELVETGRPHDVITRIAQEREADLIVLGVHGRSGVELALFGSTTHQVVRHATCPVLTIRP
jgi:nucleotide-binding universal stress UspA family protein